MRCLHAMTFIERECSTFTHYLRQRTAPFSATSNHRVLGTGQPQTKEKQTKENYRGYIKKKRMSYKKRKNSTNWVYYIPERVCSSKNLQKSNTYMSLYIRFTDTKICYSSNPTTSSLCTVIWLVCELATFTSTHPSIIIYKIPGPAWNGSDVKDLAIW